MTCPICNGKKGANAIACGEDRSCTIQWEESTCAGTGEINLHTALMLLEGKRRREDRVKRGLSLGEEADRLGIKASELSDMEWGRKPFPKEIAG